MDTLKSIITLYKRELADANELKLLYQAQLEQEQQQRVQQLEAQLRERDEQIKELRQQIPKVVEE